MRIELGNGPPPIEIAKPTAQPVTLTQPAPPTSIVTPGGGGGAASQIGGVRAAPAGVPLALVKGPDGVLRPDPAAIPARPTEPEVDAAIADAVTEHVVDVEPHPAYDDLPSLSLLFASRLV